MSSQRFYVYATRIVPAISVASVVLLLIFSYVVAPYGQRWNGDQDAGLTLSQQMLVGYTIFLHLLSILFPARLCWAIFDMIRKMKQNASITGQERPLKTQTFKTSRGAVAFPVPLFVIIIPNYKEDMDTLEETLRVLASHPQACRCYDIYLAMEEKEEDAPQKARQLINSFPNSFRRMCYTLHPSGIPGEAQGKSSNEAWAARQAFKDFPEAMKKNIVMTVMDADSHLSTRYFAQIAHNHLGRPDTNQTTIYVPPLVFDRNLHHVPLLVRAADLAWAGAGLSSLYAGSDICIPTSVYSLPLTLVERVGGWDTDPGSIGEDMHMYIKCFFALSGNLDVKIIYAAVSSCNVSSNISGWSGYFDGLQARYRQAIRHMWGSLDTGYALRQTTDMVGRHLAHHRALLGNPTTLVATAQQIAESLSASLSTVCFPSGMSFPSEPGLHKPLLSSPETASVSYLKPIHKQNLLTLYHRLFEAHFLPVHLAVILATSTIYEKILGGAVPAELRMTLLFSEHSRTLGWLLMALFFHRYGAYHRLCVQLRQKEMERAGMLETLTAHDAFTPQMSKTAGLLEALLFPVGGLIFGSIPHCQAIFSHLFTDRLTYRVSLKPQWAMRAWSQGENRPGPRSLPSSTRTHRSSHVRCPSDSWRKQAASLAAGVSLRWNRPVKED